MPIRWCLSNEPNGVTSQTAVVMCHVNHWPVSWAIFKPCCPSKVGRLLSVDILLFLALPFGSGFVTYCISSHSGLYVTTCSNCSVSSPSRLAWKVLKGQRCHVYVDGWGWRNGGRSSSAAPVKPCYSSRITTCRLNRVLYCIVLW